MANLEGLKKAAVVCYHKHDNQFCATVTLYQFETDSKLESLRNKIKNKLEKMNYATFSEEVTVGLNNV